MLGPGEVGATGFRFRPGKQSGVDQLLRSSQSALAANHHTLGNSNHFLGLLRQKIGVV